MNYRCVILQVMARPRTIHPNGQVLRVVTHLPEPLVRKLEREARKRRVPLAQVVREKLQQVA